MPSKSDDLVIRTNYLAFVIFSLQSWTSVIMVAFYSSSVFCVSVCAGRRDGAERDSQIQEEIRHLSALQADLNLNAGAPQCF